MFERFQLFPRAASGLAEDIDALYVFLVVMTVFGVAAIFLALIVFSVRYRRRPGRHARQIEGSVPLEILWIAVPFVLWTFVFGWGAKLYLEVNVQPREGMQFFVTGKQWMWKIQHPSGQREINTLHVPVGETILLTLASEDVIHSFYLPAFRVKQDVVPGMYTSMWFRPDRIGTYHLFCAEYCGTKHSEMTGQVVVMDPSDYQSWLSGQPSVTDPVEAGRLLFERLRCDTCHAPGAAQRGPVLDGRFGTEVALASGETVLFDEAYARRSILEPNEEISAGYRPQMPSYRDQVTETQIQYLIAYIESSGIAAEDEAGEGQEDIGEEAAGDEGR